MLQPWVEEFTSYNSSFFDEPWFADKGPFRLRVLDLLGVVFSSGSPDLVPLLVAQSPDVECLSFMDYFGLEGARLVLGAILTSCPKFRKLVIAICCDGDKPSLDACALFGGGPWPSDVELRGASILSQTVADLAPGTIQKFC